MTQKIMKSLYRLTGGKPLQKTPVQMLKTSCNKLSADYFNNTLKDLETLGYINTYKKTIKGMPQIHSVELTTYGKYLFEKEQLLSLSLHDSEG